MRHFEVWRLRLKQWWLGRFVWEQNITVTADQFEFVCAVLRFDREGADWLYGGRGEYGGGVRRGEGYVDREDMRPSRISRNWGRSPHHADAVVARRRSSAPGQEAITMDILEQIVAGIAKGMLPQGKTLAEVKPFDEGEQRMDALASHAIAETVKGFAPPIVGILYEAARPMVDGALVGALGGLRPQEKRKLQSKQRKTAKAAATKELVKRKAYGPTEILDAEFVDVPEVKK
jgi:hypothetical protein